MLEDYKNALKSGQRAYRACVARGQSPYLAVLDDILVNVNIVSQEPLGLVEIPAESIVGTKTSGRHTAFAPNFMPLLEADTEFAAKWSNLCEAHLEEGIQNPILAYEFMNRFYVQEGNKRVSVLKYYGAVKIAGTVTRLIPARNDSLENRIYYEFLDFYKLSQINYVHFSRTGGYAKLQTLVCKASGESWTEDDRLNFSAFYTVFRQQFIALGGHDLKLTTGDGLLVLEPHMSGILLTTAIVGTILLLGGSGGIITWGCAGAALFLLETLLKHVDSIDYLQSRLDGWTQDLDRMTSQTKQSLYAIGSGGATGLGLGNSIEKQLWLPESTNDFIFSVVCEELGFVGAVIVIVLFVLFLVQGFWIAFHAENRFCTLVGIGIMAQIAWQVFCNIAVVTNTLPNTGISLPFFSSGGTSLILLLAEMGVMVNIGRNGERARLEREEAHAERERQRKAKTIVLDTARRAQTEQ